jgi:4-aminobutyrate aminotransferase-like enzyme
MRAWGESAGEAIHTSTFLGHPVGCAMGVAAIREMQAQRLDQAAAAKGKRLMEMLRPLAERHRRVGDIRGRGLMVGIELVTDRGTKEPDRQAAWKVVVGALKRGLILLGGGQRRNVLSISPPLTIAEQQLDFLARTIDECLKELS